MIVSIDSLRSGRSSETLAERASGGAGSDRQRQRDEEVKARPRERGERRVGPQRVELAVGEVDHVHEAEDEGEPDARAGVRGPPSTSPFSRCWSSCSIRARRATSSRAKSGQRDLAVLDLDDEDARLALAALLAGRAVLLELDRAVHAHEAHLPERIAHGLGLGLAGDPDRLGDGERCRRGRGSPRSAPRTDGRAWPTRRRRPWRACRRAWPPGTTAGRTGCGSVPSAAAPACLMSWRRRRAAAGGDRPCASGAAPAPASAPG